jgi:uncharacterized membrane protein YfcA
VTIRGSFKMAVGLTCFLGCAFGIVIGGVISIHYLGPWSMLTIPLLIIVAVTCMIWLLDWSTDPQADSWRKQR